MAKRTVKRKTAAPDAGRRRTDRRSSDRRGERKGAEARNHAVTLLVATSNPHKIKEIVAMLGDLPVNLKTLKDFPDIKIADETASTFQQIAREKALYYAAASGILTMAEDSGFEVDALDCQPGILSARYLGPDATYPERFAAIYAALKKRKVASTNARFVCALALASGRNITFETKGVVEGQIAETPAGDGGFGYDPIFCYPPYGKTFAEVSVKDKAAVSHRGEAIRALRAHLEQNLKNP